MIKALAILSHLFFKILLSPASSQKEVVVSSNVYFSYLIIQGGAKADVQVWLFKAVYSNCIIFHTDHCKSTFVPPCILAFKNHLVLPFSLDFHFSLYLKETSTLDGVASRRLLTFIVWIQSSIVERIHSLLSEFQAPQHPGKGHV